MGRTSTSVIASPVSHDVAVHDQQQHNTREQGIMTKIIYTACITGMRGDHTPNARPSITISGVAVDQRGNRTDLGVIASRDWWEDRFFGEPMVCALIEEMGFEIKKHPFEFHPKSFAHRDGPRSREEWEHVFGAMTVEVRWTPDWGFNFVEFLEGPPRTGRGIAASEAIREAAHG